MWTGFNVTWTFPKPNNFSSLQQGNSGRRGDATTIEIQVTLKPDLER